MRPLRMTSACLFLAVILTVLDSTVCESELCDDAYQQIFSYSQIWKITRLVNNLTTQHDSLDIHAPNYLEDYAKNICSVVKPKALELFRSRVAGCQNVDDIIALVDENRGFCSGNNLNPRIKQSIIDRLSPIDPDDYDQCVVYDNDACAAPVKLWERQPPIRFRNETDKIYDGIWECLVNVYKPQSLNCPNWQLLFLLSLDTMNEPVLFQMRLTEQQIAMLELNEAAPTGTSPGSAKTRKNKKLRKKKKKKTKKKKGRKAKKVKSPKITIGKGKKKFKATSQTSNKGKSGRKSG